MTTLVFSRTAVSALLAAAALSACVLGPDYVAPDVPKITRITAAALPAETVSTPVRGGEAQRFVQGGVLPAEWWKAFGSPVLDGWVDEAFAKSPTLASAEATLRQQQALFEATTGLLYPSVTANLGAARRKTSASAFGGGGVRGSIFNLYEGSLDVSYGLDLWGATLRTFEGQKALVDANRYHTSAAYLTLAGNVVTAAVAMASAELRLKTATPLIEEYYDTVRLTEKKYELGAGTKADVIAIKTSLAQFEAQLLPLRQEIASSRNHLAALLGRYPSEFDSQNFGFDKLTLPQDIPVSLPSELLRNRPDIAASSAQLAVASANVGIATTNQFPSIALTASVGTQAAKPRRLFDETIWSLAGNLSAPLFDAGSLSAKKRASVAAYDAAQANYRQTVLTAFNEVSDLLTALETDATVLAAQQRALDLARQSLKLTEAGYRTGTATVFELREARVTAARSELDFISALAARYRDTALLFQALGGEGWQDKPAAASTASN